MQLLFGSSKGGQSGEFEHPLTSNSTAELSSLGEGGVALVERSVEGAEGGQAAWISSICAGDSIQPGSWGFLVFWHQLQTHDLTRIPSMLAHRQKERQRVIITCTFTVRHHGINELGVSSSPL